MISHKNIHNHRMYMSMSLRAPGVNIKFVYKLG